MEYPQIFRNPEGVELIAKDDVQAAAMQREGFQPVGKFTEKPAKPTKSE